MNSVEAQLREEIARNGPISFARFMEAALYAPGDGYYERAQVIGRTGDFHTSVSVGPLFGELLAFQFADWLRAVPSAKETGETGSLQILELGAHDGRLAADILGALQRHAPEIFQRIEYWIADPSRVRRDWQKKTLLEFNPNIRWFESWDDIVQRGVRGIIFSNEFFDALPVHRIGWSARQSQWFEWRVALDGDRFVWEKNYNPESFQFEAPKLAEELLRVLPDDFTTDVSPAAVAWWTRTASALRSGKLITLDYGLEEEDFFLPQRAAGTLRAYLRHQLREDVLIEPGEQDLTAHVNFTALRLTGERQGLLTEAQSTQTQFLTRVAGQTWVKPEAFPEWNGPRKRQFQTLTHPEHLGRSFRVLVQRR